MNKRTHSLPVLVLTAITLYLLSATTIFGQDEDTADNDASAAVESSDGITIPAPPKGLKYKQPNTIMKLKKKPENDYFTGLPLLNNDPDRGVGYGVRLYYYENGDKEDPFFYYAPYRSRLYAQFFQTTNGYSYHEVNFDAPYIYDSLWRLQAVTYLQINTNAFYFGNGSNNSYDLTLPRNEGTVKTYADYNDTLRKNVSGNTDGFYNFYSYSEPGVNLSLQRDLFGSRVRGLFGLLIKHRDVDDYTGEKIESIDNAVQRQTRLKGDRPLGYNGGWDNAVRLGVAYDTRDFEPDPSQGWFIETAADFVGPYTGADFDYVRFTFSPKYFFSPFKTLVDQDNLFRRFTLGTRLVYSMISTKDAPFWSFGQIANTTFSGSDDYLGGLRSMRGFKPNRFSGQSLNELNFEIRWTLFDFDVLGQNFAIMLVPFIDVGQANEDIAVGVDNLQMSYGAGLRIPWNQATIIMVDYAMSREGANMYINFNHIF